MVVVPVPENVNAAVVLWAPPLNPVVPPVPVKIALERNLVETTTPLVAAYPATPRFLH
jgi:hypothetical protein